MKKLVSLLLALALLVSMSSVAFAAKEDFDPELVAAAQAEGELTVYGSCEEPYLAAAAKNFEKEFGIKVSYLRLSTGEVQAKITEEKGNPSADVWFGGTNDPYNESAKLGLLMAYEAKNAKNLASPMYRDADGYWYGIYKGILGFMVNTEELKRLNLEAPKGWDDLLKPEYKDKISAVLEKTDTYWSLDKPLQEIKLANEEWRVLLGDESYDNLFALLEKGGFFKPLFKDELLQLLDRIYSFSESTSDFRRNLEQEGGYMRLVTKNDKSYYVYGIKDSGFYLKDVSLPQKYRFGNIRFDGHGMSADEQKHYLYDHVFKALNASSGYEDFKKNLAEESIRVTEHVNGKGTYGISFYMENVENAHLFKGADLSRKLTYQNIQKHFDGVAVGLSSHINRVGEFRERVDREAFYMQGRGVPAIPDLDITGSGKKSQEDDLIPSKKKRKRKSGPDFSL